MQRWAARERMNLFVEGGREQSSALMRAKRRFTSMAGCAASSSKAATLLRAIAHMMAVPADSSDRVLKISTFKWKQGACTATVDTGTGVQSARSKNRGGVDVDGWKRRGRDGSGRFEWALGLRREAKEVFC
jgi:hypothetical protein